MIVLSLPWVFRASMGGSSGDTRAVQLAPNGGQCSEGPAVWAENPPALKLTSLQRFSTSHNLRREEWPDGEEARLLLLGPFTSLSLSVPLPPYPPSTPTPPQARCRSFSQCGLGTPGIRIPWNDHSDSESLTVH